MKKSKQEIITFKVDDDLMERLRSLPNRSEFIRRAVLSAMQEVCPLCQGTGALSPNQKKHWDDFIASHSLEKCDTCHEVHLVCESRGPDDPHH
jgi:hypothetical protein